MLDCQESGLQPRASVRHTEASIPGSSWCRSLLNGLASYLADRFTEWRAATDLASHHERRWISRETSPFKSPLFLRTGEIAVSRSSIGQEAESWAGLSFEAGGCFHRR